MVQAARRSVVREGRKLSYLEAGTGRPLLLLHAFPLDASMWQPQLDAVPAGWRAIAPDYAGFGASDPYPASPPLDAYAADAIALLDALAIDRAVLAGLSLGGYVAFAAWRLAADRIAGLVLADTRPQADSDEGRRNREAMLELLARQGVSAVADQMAPKLLSEPTRRDRPDVAARVRGLIERNGPTGIRHAIEAMMRRPDSTPLLPAIDRPALVLVGEHDALTPVSDAEAMRDRLPRATLRVIPAAGHLSNLENPDAFNAALSAFLSHEPIDV